MSVPKAKRKTDPCPCGSGTQYRYCHGAPPPEPELGPALQRSPRQIFLWVVLIGAPLAWVAGLYFDRSGGASQNEAPGEAPAGKVWSEAHGHWHDAAGTAPAAPILADPSSGKPWDHPYTLERPDGEPPPNSTWSEAHGHWHENE